MGKEVIGSYDQDRFAEVQNDAADETATLNTTNGNFSKDINTVFRVRFTVQQIATAATSQLTVTPTLFYSYNTGSWTEVGNPTDTDAPVRVINEANVTDNATTTLRLGSGDSNVAGRFEDTAPGATAVTFTDPSTGEATEYEWALEIYGDYAGLANDDTIKLRVYNTATVLDTYTNQPTITVSGVVAGTDDLLADDVESASETSTPVITQIHALLADDTESTSETSTPAVGQLHVLLADDTESASETSSPALSENLAAGSYAIRDPRIEMPELFQPNRKPIGDVVIDRSNVIGKKVISCVLNQRNFDGTYSYGAVSRGNQVFSFNGTDEGFVIQNNPPVRKSYSVYVRCKSPAAPISEIDNWTYLIETGSGNITWNHATSGNEGMCAYHDGAQVNFIQYNTLTANVWHSLGYTVNKGLTAYQEGVAIGSTGTLDATKTQAGLDSSIAQWDANYFWEGEIEIALILQPLTAGEHALLHANPYQIFIPA